MNDPTEDPMPALTAQDVAGRLRRPGVHPIGETVTFTFNGQSVEALPGETIAAALAASGINALRRTDGASGPDGNEWRGLYCGMGACFDCVVTIDGRAGQRACLARVNGGEAVRSRQPAGTIRDPLLPLADRPKDGALETCVTDILVIGAGPAGLSAALSARRAGAQVHVLDERAHPGGQYYKPVASSHKVLRPTDRQFADGHTLVGEVLASGVTLVNSAVVWGAYSAREVLVFVDGRAVVFHPKRLILATGAYERPMPVPGWTLPGVMTTGAAQTLARSYQISPGQRVVIAGNGPLNFQLAADLVKCGVNVVAVAEAAQRPDSTSLRSLARAVWLDSSKMLEGARYLGQLITKRVPVFWSHTIVSAAGQGRLSTVTLAPLSKAGDIDVDGSRRFDADTLCLGYGFVASSEIAAALGCRLTRDSRHLGSFEVETNDDHESSIEGVFVVGDGQRVQGADFARAAGEIAGTKASTQLGFHLASGDQSTAARKRREQARRFQTALWSLFRAPPVDLEKVSDETILCRCEGLTFGCVRNEIRQGAASLAVLKRRTRLGMGRCQGRYCTPSAAHLVERAAGNSTGVQKGFAPRLPVKPFPAVALAIEKPEWGGHERAGSPDLSRSVPLEHFGTDTADIVVIGGGVVGACVAHELAMAGRDVLVLERDDANLQASGANAGSLHVQLLSFDFGSKAEAGGGPAAATLPLGPWAISLWQDLARACDHDFEIRITGGLMVAESEAGMSFLKRKAALERRHGLDADIVGPNELKNMAPALSDRLIGAEFSPLEGKINPLTATYRVLEQARRAGARFLRSTDVTGLRRLNGHWQIDTNRGMVSAGAVVNAAGPWARQIGEMAGLDIPVYSAPLQMIVTERAPQLVDQLVAHADRHLSLKQLSSGGIVIGGAWTARYSAHQNMNVTRRESIEGNLWVADAVLPQLSGLHVIRTWAGMNVNIDGAPIVGEAPGLPGFYNAVTSNGYTLAPAIARLTAQIMGGHGTEMNITPFLIDRFNGNSR